MRSPDPQVPNPAEPVRGTHLLAFLSWAKRRLAELAQAWLTIKEIDETAYTLGLGDDGLYLRMLRPGVLTVPPRSSVQFRAGAVVHVRSVGGQVHVVGGPGVLINTAATTYSRTAHSSVMLVHVGLDVWDMLGDMAP